MIAPRFLVYPRATVVAEKFEAIVVLGMANSRMKDYFDLMTLAREAMIDPSLLGRAIAATFTRRGTPLPSEPPLGLLDEFARNRDKITQWNAFLRKNRLAAASLEVVVREVREFLVGPLRDAAQKIGRA